MVAPLRPNAVLPMEEPTIARPGMGAATPTPNLGEARTVSFAETVREAVSEVNRTQAQAAEAATQYAEGKQNDLHGTMIAMAQADISLRLVANVRNRVIEAYREIMRMGA